MVRQDQGQAELLVALLSWLSQVEQKFKELPIVLLQVEGTRAAQHTELRLELLHQDQSIQILPIRKSHLQEQAPEEALDHILLGLLDVGHIRPGLLVLREEVLTNQVALGLHLVRLGHLQVPLERAVLLAKVLRLVLKAEEEGNEKKYFIDTKYCA